jgi:hypothetical protein
MTTKDSERPLGEVNRIGLESLIRALGTADAERFLDHCRTGVKDYTEERHAWLDRLSRADILDSMQDRPHDSDSRAGLEDQRESADDAHESPAARQKVTR